MNNANEQLGQGLQGAANLYPAKAQAAQAAQKPWAEIPIEQKLERLQEELLGARRDRRWQYERFARIDEKLRHLDSHQHGNGGTVMVRARDMQRGYGEAGQAISGGFDPLA